MKILTKYRPRECLIKVARYCIYSPKIETVINAPNHFHYDYIFQAHTALCYKHVHSVDNPLSCTDIINIGNENTTLCGRRLCNACHQGFSQTVQLDCRDPAIF